MSSVGSKVLSGFRWLAAGKFAGQLITWAITILVIRILSPDDYGLMAMASVAIGFLALFDEMGMGAALVQREDLEHDLARQIFAAVLLINGAAFLILLILAPIVAQFFNEPRLIAISVVLAIQFPLLALQVIPDAVIRRQMAFKQKSAVLFVAAVAGGFVTLGFAYGGAGVWALVIGSLATTVIRVVGLNWIAKYFCWPNFRFTKIRSVIVFGGQVTIERLLWFVYTQADIFLVGKILGKYLLGVYSVAIHLATLPMTKLGGILYEVAFSGFSRLQSQPKEVNKRLLDGFTLVSLFAFPVFFGLAAVSEEVVKVFLGSKWTEAILPLKLICLILPLRMLDMVLPAALVGLGHTKLAMNNGIIASIIMPVSFAIGVNWGIEGVCYGWIIGYPIYYVLVVIRSLPKLHTTLQEYTRAVAGPAIAGGVMLVALYFVRRVLESTENGDTLNLAILVAAGAAIYGSLVILTQRQAVAQFYRLVKQ